MLWMLDETNADFGLQIAELKSRIPNLNPITGCWLLLNYTNRLMYT